MGKFSFRPPNNVALVNMISSSGDPWVIPSPNQIDNLGNTMMLGPIKQAYQAVLLASTAAYGTQLDDHGPRLVFKNLLTRFFIF